MSPRLAGFSAEGESQRSGEPGAMNDRERRYACRVGRLFSTERHMFICGGRGRTHRRCGPLRRATQRVAGWGGRKQILRRYAPQNDRGRRGARNDKERREDRCAMAGGTDEGRLSPGVPRRLRFDDDHSPCRPTVRRRGTRADNMLELHQLPHEGTLRAAARCAANKKGGASESTSWRWTAAPVYLGCLPM